MKKVVVVFFTALFFTVIGPNANCGAVPYTREKLASHVDVDLVRYQPALDALKDAKTQLQATTTSDEGGHYAKALEAVSKAINEANLAVKVVKEGVAKP